MVGMVVLISGVGPGGSVVVEDTLSGRIWIYLVAGLVLLAVAWPSLSRLQVQTTTTPRDDVPSSRSGAPLGDVGGRES
jgi:hypothetical protein